MRLAGVLGLTLLGFVNAASADEVVRIAEQFRIFFTVDPLTPDTSAARVLRAIADAAQPLKELRVRIDGYADRSGDSETNLVISRERAAIVRRALVELGVPDNVLVDVGHGEANPFISTADGVREPLNRRVEITLTGIQDRNPVDEILPLAHLE